MCPGAPRGELSTACKGLEMTVPSRVWFTHPHLLLPAQHLAFLCSRGAWAPEHWGFDWGQGTSPQTEEKSPQYLQSRILRAHRVQLVPKALTCSFLPGEFSPRNSHYAGVGGSLPWHHTPLAVQEKVAAAVPNTTTPLPTSQLPSAGIHRGWKAAPWTNTTGSTAKGTAGCSQCLLCPRCLLGCLCSITSQHTQLKVTEKAAGNKEKPELEHCSQGWNSSGKQESSI